jgi:sulfite dehydrogenase (quinone) subunit SoeA
MSDMSPSSEIKYTTCYMCACRCGIKVHLRDGRIRYIDGNRNHPVNRGVICAKGSAGIMQQYSPARLSKPLLRIGERGRGEFREIEWGEALGIACQWLGRIRETDPRKLAFFTGRDQSQSLTGWWAKQFGTPNYAAHGGFCSVNMAAAGLYTIGGSFWEFGEPDWERARYFLMFGVAEDHDSNPIKIGLGKLKARGVKIVSVNPVRTGYSAIADEWVPIRPGTDGLFVFALMHELLHAQRVDVEYLARYTNAPWLVLANPGRDDDGLFARENGKPLVWDPIRGMAVHAGEPDVSPALTGEFTLADGRQAVPVFALLAQRYRSGEYSPDAVSARCGVSAQKIRRIAAELAQAAFDQQIVLAQPWTDCAGRRHETMTGRPVAMHAMRGISAHSNGFHTCRALHFLQLLLGTIDSPGGFRYEAPFPRPCPGAPKPAGKISAPNTPLDGMPLGNPSGPEDLLIDANGAPLRIDKAYSWDAPLAAHGLMHMVVRNAWAGDPYPIDTLLLYMANLSWNSAMNTAETMSMLTDRTADGEYKIPHVIYADAFYSETVAFADLVLPDTTYLERWDAISLLDRPISSADGPADSIRQPVLAPDRDVRPFQDVLIDLGARLKLPGFVQEDGRPLYRDYPDYLARHERRPGIGPLAGWRGSDGRSEGRGEPNPRQLQKYVENQCFWKYELPPGERYFKHANRAYLETAKRFGFVENTEQIVLQIYCEPLQRFRLAARGHGPVQPPQMHRSRIEKFFDPLPVWYPPLSEGSLNAEKFPLHAVTQRPMAMYHAWHSHNAWLRQILSCNRLYVNRARAAALGFHDDDWVWVISAHSRLKCQVRLMEGVNGDTVWTWNGIGKRAGAWNLALDGPESTRGFLLNHLIPELLPPESSYRYGNCDPITGQAAWYDLRVRIEKADEIGRAEPQFPPLARPPHLVPPPAILRHPADRAPALGARSIR